MDTVISEGLTRNYSMLCVFGMTPGFVDIGIMARCFCKWLLNIQHFVQAMDIDVGARMLFQHTNLS